MHKKILALYIKFPIFFYNVETVVWLRKIELAFHTQLLNPFTQLACILKKSFFRYTCPSSRLFLEKMKVA